MLDRYAFQPKTGLCDTKKIQRNFRGRVLRLPSLARVFFVSLSFARVACDDLENKYKENDHS